MTRRSVRVRTPQIARRYDKSLHRVNPRSHDLSSDQ